MSHLKLSRMSFMTVLISTVYIVACFGDEKGQGSKYVTLFNEGLKRCHQYRNPYGGIAPYNPVTEDLTFEPIEGLDGSWAVPFLISVLNKSPEWLPESEHHLAKCYAAVCLGATKDPAALEPLLEAVKKIDDKENRFYIAQYAAIGLGLSGNRDAVEPLIETMRDKNHKRRHICVWPLVKLGDLKAVGPLIDELNAQDDPLATCEFVSAISKLARIKIDDSELSDKQFLSEWWKKGPRFTEERLERYYSERTSMKKETEGERNLARAKIYKMSELGIAGLPFMMEKVKKGETVFMPVISQITDGQLKKTATQTECLKWWRENKEKWLIPFPSAGSDPNPPSHDNKH